MVRSALGSSSGWVIHHAANPAKTRITGTQSHRVQRGPPTSNPLGESEVTGSAFVMATGYVLPAGRAFPVPSGRARLSRGRQLMLTAPQAGERRRAMLRFSGLGVTDVGLVREHNEDSAFLGPYVAAVADGV